MRLGTSVTCGHQLENIWHVVGLNLKIKTLKFEFLWILSFAGSEEDKKIKECDAKIQLAKFWRDITMVLRKYGNLKDVCLMEYEVKHLLFPLDMEDNEKKVNKINFCCSVRKVKSTSSKLALHCIPVFQISLCISST